MLMEIVRRLILTVNS